MHTFKLSLNLTLSATMPAHVEEAIIEAATKPGPDGEPCPQYLVELHKQFGEGEAFLLAVLQANLRGKLRGFTEHMLTQAGLGCRVSPVTVNLLTREEEEAIPVPEPVSGE